MAIQVGGTTVIDDSRNVQNVGGFKTINGTSILGSGDISAGGASTSFGDVGTYLMGHDPNTNIALGATVAGSTIERVSGGDIFDGWHSPSLSGTWRNMGYHASSGYLSSLFVRVS